MGNQTATNRQSLFKKALRATPKILGRLIRGPLRVCASALLIGVSAPIYLSSLYFTRNTISDVTRWNLAETGFRYASELLYDGIKDITSPIHVPIRGIYSHFKGSSKKNEKKQAIQKSPVKHQMKTKTENKENDLDVTKAASTLTTDEKHRSVPTKDEAPAAEVHANFSQAQNYQQALAEYKKSNNVPFKTRLDSTDEKGIRTMIFIDSKTSNENKDNPDYQVKYLIDAEGKMSIEVGKNVSCVLPPQSRDKGEGYEVIKVENGKSQYVAEKGERNSETKLKVAGKEITSNELLKGSEQANESRVRLSKGAAISDTPRPSPTPSQGSTLQNQPGQARR